MQKLFVDQHSPVGSACTWMCPKSLATKQAKSLSVSLLPLLPPTGVMGPQDAEWTGFSRPLVPSYPSPLTGPEKPSSLPWFKEEGDPTTVSEEAHWRDPCTPRGLWTHPVGLGVTWWLEETQDLTPMGPRLLNRLRSRLWDVRAEERGATWMDWR